MEDSDRYERVIRDWASLASKPMQAWETERMNALVDEMQRLQLLVRETEKGRTVIEALADDHDPRVRMWAATHCSKWNRFLARRVLTRLRDGGGPGSFEATWTLVEMDQGRLNVDWTPASPPRH